MLNPVTTDLFRYMNYGLYYMDAVNSGIALLSILFTGKSFSLLCNHPLHAMDMPGLFGWMIILTQMYTNTCYRCYFGNLGQEKLHVSFSSPDLVTQGSSAHINSCLLLFFSLRFKKMKQSPRLRWFLSTSFCPWYSSTFLPLIIHWLHRSLGCHAHDSCFGFHHPYDQ